MKNSPLSKVVVEVYPDHLVIQGNTISIPNIFFFHEIFPRGANGLVFFAKDRFLNRPVAVKIWIPRKNDRRNRKVQALAEASKIAQLNHIGIVQIYECREHTNGLIYSVMEYLEGMTLDDFLRITKPDFSQRYRLWMQINEALSYAHSKSIYHGDLHPRNIRVVNGIIKLLDFGTSFFAGRTVAESRESKFVIQIATILFPEDKPNINEVTDLDLSKLKPSLVMAALSAWVSIMAIWEEIQSVISETPHGPMLDDLLRTRMHSLAHTISTAPVFSVEKVLKKLAAEGVPTVSQNSFLGFCTIWAETMLSDSRDLHFPARNRLENENQLKTLWPALLAAFLARGPF